MILHAHADNRHLCNVFIAQNILSTDFSGYLSFYFHSGRKIFFWNSECKVGLTFGASILNDHIDYDTSFSNRGKYFSRYSRLIMNFSKGYTGLILVVCNSRNDKLFHAGIFTNNHGSLLFTER